MFLNFLKNIYVKRSLKSRLHNVENNGLSGSVKTIGLLIDESLFKEKEALVQELIKSGFLESNINVIVYSDKFKKNEVYSQPTFGIAHLNWRSEITNVAINSFINENFDLLISYYDVEKAILLLITNNSKAKFKIGFSSVDKRLNHLVIDSNVGNYKVFVHELFKYLKILNKI
jgi:hypothetical protein